MAAIAAAVGVLAVPAAASAATKTVDMGTPISSQKAFQKAFADVNDFFPHGTTIHVGDSIKFVPTGFHTVDFPAQGRQAARPDRYRPAARRRRPRRRRRAVLVQRPADARLHPGPRPARALRQEGHLHRRQARRVGAPLAQKPKPFTVKFTKAGTLHVLLRHPLGDEGHGQGRVQEPQRPVGEGRRQDAEDPGRLGAEHGQGADQDHGRGGQRQRRRVRPAWRRVLRDVPGDPDGPGRARR